MGITKDLANTVLHENMGSLTDAETQTGLPVANPCLSFWQQTTRSFPSLNANQDGRVPQKSAYVVIGSGISGALAAFELIESGALAEDITILEAREAASGASSRNAGHVRPGRCIPSLHVNFTDVDV